MHVCLNGLCVQSLTGRMPQSVLVSTKMQSNIIVMCKACTLLWDRWAQHAAGCRSCDDLAANRLDSNKMVTEVGSLASTITITHNAAANTHQLPQLLTFFCLIQLHVQGGLNLRQSHNHHKAETKKHVAP